MSAPYSSKAVANEFIELARDGGRSDLSPMKLQKLVYFAHAWYLAYYDQPLIREEVQAWQFGPVVPEIYHEFKSYGNSSISKYGTELSFESNDLALVEPRIDREDTQALDFIKEVWRVYGEFTPIQLSNLTHEEGSPWSIVAKQYSSELPRNIDIPRDLIQGYFKTILQKQKA